MFYEVKTTITSRIEIPDDGGEWDVAHRVDIDGGEFASIAGPKVTYAVVEGGARHVADHLAFGGPVTVITEEKDDGKDE